MTPAAATELLRAQTETWCADPDSDVVWAGWYDGRWGIRMTQTVREATTIWFDVGSLTVAAEAYLLPAPRDRSTDAHVIGLARNRRSWPSFVYTDARGDFYVGARVRLSEFGQATLDEMVGAIYETVEVSFRPMLRASQSPREKSS